MGKSDNQVFNFYLKILKDCNLKYDSIAFLGFSGENSFTRCIDGKIRDFYDLNLKNWQINDEWNLKRKYDLILCTRCAYFSKNPNDFISRCKLHLNKNGKALIDWGLGDHWRFEKFKVGWIRDGEHEFAYQNNNFLHSCFWHDDLDKDLEVQKFWKAVKAGNYGYDISENLNDIVKKEVPSLINYETIFLKTLFLWPESPQLYIATVLENF